jgi:hypothetical protein
MKRYPVFAVAALLFLLLFLLGSWVYVRNYQWPFAGEASEADQHARAADVLVGRPDEDPFADVPDAEGGTDGAGGRGPLEIPSEPVRRAIPPASVETGRGTKPEAASAKVEDVIVAEKTPGVAAVRARDGSERGLDPFIVSTLPPAAARETFKSSSMTTEADESVERLIENDEGYEKAFAIPKVLDSVLRGEVVWPSLPAADAEALEEANRFQAVVYLAGLPEFRAVVDQSNRAFRLPLTSKMEDEYRSKGLHLVVHSVAFEIGGGYESITVKKDDGPIKVSMQVASKIAVVVDVSPPEAIADGVRVWLERRGGPSGPDRDDSLYMSARVPSSGRLVFTVPGHYGEFRVAATGARWHSGLPQELNLRDWRTNKVTVALQLAAEACSRLTGVVKYYMGAESEAPVVAGARLESTDYATTVYTGPDGHYDIWLPSDLSRANRQMIVRANGLRPEVIALDRANDSTAGVGTVSYSQPVTVMMAWKTSLKLVLPKLLSHCSTVLVGGAVSAEAVEVSGGSTSTVEVPWGADVLVIVDPEKSENEPVTVYINPKDWSDVFNHYAAGKSSAASIQLKTLDEVFKKR